MLDATDYREYLRNRLIERISKNAGYSLRSLARDLGLQPSHLSSVMAGKKGLSKEKAIAVTGRLKLTKKQSEYFLTLVEYDQAKSVELKEHFLNKLKKLNKKIQVQSLTIDAFKAISDWYHIPLLEMTGLNDPDFSAATASKKLGISKLEAQSAIARLERLELIERDKNGVYKKTYRFGAFNSDTGNQGLRKFHKQMLEKAIVSLDTQSPQEKYVGSETLCINSKDLTEAKKMLDEFREKFVLLCEKNKSKDRVYHLGLQFFNLTDGERKK